MMSLKEALKRGEQTLKERIEHKADTRTTDEKLFEELSAKIYQVGNLVGEYHAAVNRILSNEREHIRNLKVALESYKKAIKR